MIPKIRAWDSELKQMIDSKVEQLDDSVNIRFSEHFEEEYPKYMAGTGLRGKNERLIYEGDIVKFNDQVGTIVFECGAFGIAIDDGVDYDRIQMFMNESEEVPFLEEFNGCMNDNFISLWEIYWNLCCIENYLYMVEVIGNIHEHPELLDETK